MKTFIVSMGLFILCTAMLMYRSDFNDYMIMQKQLDSFTEECARGCSLFVDIENYSEGDYIIDENGAEIYLSFMTEQLQKNLPLFADPTVTASFHIDNKDGHLYVNVDASAESKKLFRSIGKSISIINSHEEYSWE